MAARVEKGEAICLRAVDYSDTSQIVALFSRAHGLISAIAKGSRRPGSRFEGALEPLRRVEVVFRRGRESALHTLTEVDILETFSGARKDLRRLYAASYVVELLRELVRPEDPHEALYDLATAALRRIAEGKGVALAVARFEARALALLGILPELEACVECRAPLARETAPRWSDRAGGALCPRCAPHHPGARAASPAALRTLASLAGEEAVGRLSVPEALRREVRELLDRYLEAALEKELRLARRVS